MKNTFVVYDTQFGNTERIARTIAAILSEFGQVRAVRVDQIHLDALRGVDLLILGSPTQGFRPTLAMQPFLRTVTFQSLNNLAVACFDTRFRGALWKNSAAPRMVRRLRSLRSSRLCHRRASS